MIAKDLNHWYPRHTVFYGRSVWFSSRTVFPLHRLSFLSFPWDDSRMPPPPLFPLGARTPKHPDDTSVCMPESIYSISFVLWVTFWKFARAAACTTYLSEKIGLNSAAFWLKADVAHLDDNIRLATIVWRGWEAVNHSSAVDDEVWQESAFRACSTYLHGTSLWK